MNTKPTFEQKAREESAMMMQLQNVAIKRAAWQTCLNCEFWTPVRTIAGDGSKVDSFECSKFNAMPPPHIIVTGCPDYLNAIPF